MRAVRPLLLGHRGARATKTVPENTFASFDLALEHGCDGFEFDVRVTADGRELICHDPQYQGITVAHASAHDFQDWPTLSSVLQRYRMCAFLNVELKVPGLEKRTAELLGHFVPDRGFVVSSFLPDVIREMHSVSETIPVGLICDRPEQLVLWNKLPVSHVMPHYKLVSQALISELHGAAVKVFVWTVNRREEMRRLADAGVDGIISDDTALLVNTLVNGGTSTAHQ